MNLTDIFFSNQFETKSVNENLFFETKFTPNLGQKVAIKNFLKLSIWVTYI